MLASTALRRQSEGCWDLGSPMYADLLLRLADDFDVGGPTAAVLAGYENAPGPDAIGLRLLGSVHRVVLQRRAGALGTCYPSVGGTWEPEATWEHLRALLEERPREVREWLDRPPQTNEIGRSAALLGGLVRALNACIRPGGSPSDAPPVRLFEIGASAGLNLLADRFALTDADGHAHGPTDSPVRLEGAWEGALVGGTWPRIVERHGSDVMPIDAGTTEGRLALTAYVWPDQDDRHERLRGALGLFSRDPIVVEQLDAVAAAGRIEPVEGALTVLWHSVMWQYLDADSQDRITAHLESAGARATAASPLAHLFLEPTRRAPGGDHEFLVVLRLWPSGERRVLGVGSAHGIPCLWE